MELCHAFYNVGHFPNTSLTPIPVRNILTDFLRHSYKPSKRGSNYRLSVGKSQLQNSQQISNTFGIFGAQSLHKSVKLDISPYACYIPHNLYKEFASYSTIFFKKWLVEEKSYHIQCNIHSSITLKTLLSTVFR